jgi:hypothetical protein
MMIGKVCLVVVSDPVQQMIFNIVNGVMQNRNNPNPVTYSLKSLAL